ncbi:MAG: LDCC motif putative metal-binding protein [Bacteroidales bacterium]
MQEFDLFSYILDHKPSSGERAKIRNLLEDLPGIGEVYFLEEEIKIEYSSFKIAKEYIEEILGNNGLQKSRPKKKGIFQRFITKLIKTNEDEFGNKKLNCCD